MKNKNCKIFTHYKEISHEIEKFYRRNLLQNKNLKLQSTQSTSSTSSIIAKRRTLSSRTDELRSSSHYKPHKKYFGSHLTFPLTLLSARKQFLRISISEKIFMHGISPRIFKEIAAASTPRLRYFYKKASFGKPYDQTQLRHHYLKAKQTLRTNTLSIDFSTLSTPVQSEALQPIVPVQSEALQPITPIDFIDSCAKRSFATDNKSFVNQIGGRSFATEKLIDVCTKFCLAIDNKSLASQLLNSCNLALVTSNIRDVKTLPALRPMSSNTIFLGSYTSNFSKRRLARFTKLKKSKLDIHLTYRGNKVQKQGRELKRKEQRSVRCAKRDFAKITEILTNASLKKNIKKFTYFRRFANTSFLHWFNINDPHVFFHQSFLFSTEQSSVSYYAYKKKVFNPPLNFSKIFWRYTCTFTQSFQRNSGRKALLCEGVARLSVIDQIDRLRRLALQPMIFNPLQIAALQPITRKRRSLTNVTIKSNFVIGKHKQASTNPIELSIAKKSFAEKLIEKVVFPQKIINENDRIKWESIFRESSVPLLSESDLITFITAPPSINNSKKASISTLSESLLSERSSDKKELQLQSIDFLDSIDFVDNKSSNFVATSFAKLDKSKIWHRFATDDSEASESYTSLSNNKTPNFVQSLTNRRFGIALQPYRIAKRRSPNVRRTDYQIEDLVAKRKRKLIRNANVFPGQLVAYGTTLANNTVTTESGQILYIDSQKTTIRKAQTVLIYSQAIIAVLSEEWIKKGTPLMSLSYQKLVTGDIVQGLPKIEQFFEAPVLRDGTFWSDSLQAKLNQFFQEEREKLPLAEAVRKGFSEIQRVLVEGVLRVYISQGVLIADKHLEVIVRQMTCKGRILYSGDTGFLRNELVSLDKIENVNQVTYGQKALYHPQVRGITDASLESESFLSAASFQETTRVLSRDAIIGKTDLMRGLKERVIVGELIQAGTGLANNSVYNLF